MRPGFSGHRLCKSAAEKQKLAKHTPSQVLLRPSKPSRHTINITIALDPSSASNTTSNPAARNLRIAQPKSIP